MRSLGVDKCHPRAVCAGLGSIADHQGPAAEHLRQGGIEVFDADADVVQTLAARAQELADLRVGSRWRNKLDARASGLNEGDSDASLIQHLFPGNTETQDFAVGMTRLVAVCDGDANMVYAYESVVHFVLPIHC